MLVLISSAHRTAGLLYQRWKDFHGRNDDDTLVVRGSTVRFNSGFDQRIIDKAIAKDPQLNNAEYNSIWRDDLSTFLTRDQLEAVIEPGVTVRPPQQNIVYRAFGDPNGGGPDAFTMSIAHREMHNGVVRVVVTDYLYASHNPNPDQVVEEIAAILKQYRVTTIIGDSYAKQWVVVAFRKCGIDYRKSALDRSEIYLNFKPLVLAHQVLLIDDPKATAEFVGLVRRTYPGGKDKIDHETNAHDDLANAIAGAAVLASLDREQEFVLVPPILVSGGPRNIPGSDMGGHVDYNGGRYAPQPGQSQEAYEAKERAAQPFHKLHPDPAAPPPPERPPVGSSIPGLHAGAALGGGNAKLNSTEQFYLWNGHGRPP
jgi:hypothetical protein